MCSGIRYPHLATEDASPARRRSAPPVSRLQSLKVGFPIRKSPDQSLFAAPRGLSQRTTSFIASQRQGIHQMPFFHLIALIIDVHPKPRRRHRCRRWSFTSRGLLHPRPTGHQSRSSRRRTPELGQPPKMEGGVSTAFFRPFNHTRHVRFDHGAVKRHGDNPGRRRRTPRQRRASPRPAPVREPTIGPCLLFTMTSERANRAPPAKQRAHGRKAVLSFRMYFVQVRQHRDPKPQTKPFRFLPRPWSRSYRALQSSEPAQSKKRPAQPILDKELVEPDGIEPTT
jgi:hypothetical protein